MARISVKMLAITAAVGFGSLFAVGAASARPVSPAVIETSHLSQAVQVNHRRGHWGPGYRACSPGQAASKARRMGLRNPRVTIRRNVVRVTGWRHGHRSAVVFARARGCPVIR